MSNIIKHIRIDNLFGTKNIDWELNPSVNVLVGQNGSGKSTILNTIELSLDETQKKALRLADRCTVTLNNNHKFFSRNHNIAPNEESIRQLLEWVMRDTPQIKTVNSQRESFIKLLEKSLGNIDEITDYEKNNTTNNNLYDTLIEDNYISIEFISTINLSANSINNLTTSSGQHTTLLDIEINNEILRLLTFDDDNLKENLLSALNSLFSETQKTIEFNKNQLVVKITDGKKIDFDKLSSGERQVIFIFLKVVNASVDGALILMDEPEISLHLSWQEKLLNEIRRVNDKSQIIIVTPGQTHTFLP